MRIDVMEAVHGAPNALLDRHVPAGIPSGKTRCRGVDSDELRADGHQGAERLNEARDRGSKSNGRGARFIMQREESCSARMLLNLEDNFVDISRIIVATDVVAVPE